MASKISALILTRDEQDLIEDCLKQLSFTDEIIVLDRSSQDQTREIARKFSDKIYQTASGDFAKNRNLAASYAKNTWLLYVDADERLTRPLIAEIKMAIKNSQINLFYIPRQNYILGKWQRHGGWWPDYVPRLIKRTALITWYGEVHESPKVKGKYGYLKNPLVHLTARSVSQMLAKSVKWAKIEAKLYHQQENSEVTIARVIKAVASEFISRYFLRLGMLDGTIGLVAAIYQSLHKAAVFTYLWEIQNLQQAKFERN